MFKKLILEIELIFYCQIKLNFIEYFIRVINMKSLDVLYTVNNKYLHICLASILSLIRNGNISNLKLHIITSDFSMEDYHFAEEFLNKFNIEYYFYDLKCFDIEKFGIPNWRGTQIANARLFFQEIIGSSLSNIQNLLYLDSDLIIVNDLTSLEEFQGNGISAVKDACFKSYLQKLGGLSNYFNSGVLFINPDIWTKEDYQSKIIEFLNNCQFELVYPDQDALNCALNGHIHDLPLNYNLGANAYLFSEKYQRIYYGKKINIQSDELEIAKKDPKILHSTGVLSIKPWSDNNINPFNEEFMKYILEVNPEFQKVELSKLKKVLSSYPPIFKALVLMKSQMPEPVHNLARKLIS